MFEAPVPGQSLTTEPKSYPWESPPRLVDPEDALLFHMDKLRSPKRAKAVLDILQMGMDVVTLTQGILRNAVSKGEHTIDVSMIIAPIIHEQIVGLAQAAQIDFNEGLDDEDEDEDMEYAIRKNKSRKIIEKIEGKKDFDLEEFEPKDKPEVEPEVKEDMPEEKPQGLMARPQKDM
jgi:hypothetical protein|tara:strand:+ start:3972 stop:4499 length:528 start_codon:yes stop_codon:yes gene_type:complete